MITGKGGAGTNPLQLFENAGSHGLGLVLNGNNSTGGKTQRGSDLLTSGEKTHILLVIGDSISANSAAAAYTVINTSKNDNLNIYDGHLYAYSDPWLGPSTGPGSWPGKTGDDIISDGSKFVRTIAIGCSMGGATSFDYSREGTFSHRVIAALLYCIRLGYPVSGSGDGGNWKMTCIWALGTNDNALGYTGAQWTAYTNSGIDFLRDYGFKGKILVPKMTLLNGVVSTSIQNAQDAIVDNSKGIYQGSNFDSLTGVTYRAGDGTHFSATGNTTAGGMVKTSIHSLY